MKAPAAFVGLVGLPAGVALCVAACGARSALELPGPLLLEDAGGVTTSSTGGSCGGVECSSDAECGCDLNCCGGHCANRFNDILNCGACGNVCAGEHPYCKSGHCTTAPCDLNDGGAGCSNGSFCCGSECCAIGELCCTTHQDVFDVTGCAGPTDACTCPVGAPCSLCAAPETPIATPSGDRAIEDLRVGDLVYSVRSDGFVVVPLRRVNRVPVHNHSVIRVTLDSGRVLEISPGHPTADGRTFGDLRRGSRLDTARVVEVELVPYMHEFTYDILPASESGDYVAGGVVIGSTLKHAK